VDVRNNASGTLGSARVGGLRGEDPSSSRLLNYLRYLSAYPMIFLVKSIGEKKDILCIMYAARR